MDQKLEFFGSVDLDGKIKLPRRFSSDVCRLFAGKEIKVTVERKTKRRSLNQNAYYWSVVVQMITDALNEQGENVTIKETHELLKFKFLRVCKVVDDEVVYEYSKSTAGLKTVEFSFFVEQCILFAQEFFGVSIPPPSTQQDAYVFPEYQGKQESRSEYLERIKEYLQDITDRAQLRRYFRQVPEWLNDLDIRSLFNERREQLPLENKKVS